MKLKTIIIGMTLCAASVTFAAPIDIYVSAKGNRYESMIRKAILTEAHHDIEIRNNTDSPESFSYRYEYCAQEGDCNSIENTVTVPPHNVWNNARDSVLWVNYFNRGYYNLTVNTIVNSHTIHKSANAFGTVTVY